jgi:Zinc carboxypeptidase
MRRIRVLAAMGAVCLMIAMTAAPVSAEQPESTPGGPWAQPNQNQSLAAIRDYDELVSTLERLVARSHGAAELAYSPFRAKGSGRAIPIVTIGSGDRGIVIIANQHGDEFTVSNSAVELVRALTSNAAGAQEIRDAVTVTIIPRVNIDGFDATPIGSRGARTSTRSARSRHARRSTRSAAATTSTATTHTWSATCATTRTPDRSPSARATTRSPRRWRSATRTTPRAARRASTS